MGFGLNHRLDKRAVERDRVATCWRQTVGTRAETTSAPHSIWASHLYFLQTTLSFSGACSRTYKRSNGVSGLAYNTTHLSRNHCPSLFSGQLDAAWILRVSVCCASRRASAYRGPHCGTTSLSINRISSSIVIGKPAVFGICEVTFMRFSDPDSNSGFLVTRAALAERSLRPETFFAKTFFTYGHRDVIRAVGSGLAGSGSVDGYVL